MANLRQVSQVYDGLFKYFHTDVERAHLSKYSFAFWLDVWWDRRVAKEFHKRYYAILEAVGSENNKTIMELKYQPVVTELGHDSQQKFEMLKKWLNELPTRYLRFIPPEAFS